jgi:hypothetical protein
VRRRRDVDQRVLHRLGQRNSVDPIYDPASRSAMHRRLRADRRDHLCEAAIRATQRSWARQ